MKARCACCSTAGAPNAQSCSRVSSVAELDQALAQAKGQPVMLDLYADWCVACKEFEKYTFSSPDVQQALKGTVLLQVDVTKNVLRHINL